MAVTMKRVDAAVKTVGDDAAFPGEFEVCLSAPTVDRDKELVRAGAFLPLPDHITFDVDHGLTAQSVVGSGKPFYDGDRLMVRGTFARTDLAQTVRSLVADGHIRTTSVAMHRPKTETKDGVTHIVSAELLNGSFVSVPSCREALVVAAKAGTRAKVGARNSAGDQATIQEIHDEAVEAGAACPTPAAQDPMGASAADTIHGLAVDLGASCTAGGGTGDVAARGYGTNLRGVALRRLAGQSDQGGFVGSQEDELWVRAKRLECQARLAILTAERAEATRHDTGASSGDDDRIVGRRGGVAISARMKKAFDLADDDASTKNARRVSSAIRGYPDHLVTLAPGLPPVPSTVDPPPPDAEFTGAAPTPFDWEHPTTTVTDAVRGVTSVMGGFTGARYVDEDASEA
jgi:hypothetical protein